MKILVTGSAIKALIPNMTRRRRFWETMIAGPVAEHLFSGQLERAESLMDSLLDKKRLLHHQMQLDFELF